MLDPPNSQEANITPEQLLGSRRRKAFFAWTPVRLPKPLEDIRVLDTGVLRRVKDFQSLTDSHAASRLCIQVCDGISRMQDLPPEAFVDGAVPLLVTPRTTTETLFWVSKPRSRFALAPLASHAISDIDYLHTQAVLTYTFASGHKERLLMGLTLFALLLDVHEGYQLTNSLSDDVFANLSIFSQRLAQEDEHELFAWNPSDAHVFRIGTRMQRLEEKTIQQICIQPAGVDLP